MITILIKSWAPAVRLSALIAVLLLAACTSDSTGSEGELPNIVVTTSVLGEIVSEVVGDGANVSVVMPNGADPHDYQASASQVADMAEADLIVVNGLGLEEGMADVIAGLEADGAPILEVGPLLDPRSFDEEPCLGALSDCDPHVWLDPVRMAPVTLAIADHLTGLFPEQDWEEGAREYSGELSEVHAEVSELLLAVPPERRKLVTSHDSLGYFARRYSFEVVGVVIPGGSTLADPSSSHLAELVSVMDSEGVDVIFTDSEESSRLAETVGQALGREVSIVKLYTGSLGEPGSGAETYLGMLRANAKLITEALS